MSAADSEPGAFATTLDEVLALRSEIEKLRLQLVTKNAALQRLLELNLQHAKDMTGNAADAECWACVKIIRAALSDEKLERCEHGNHLHTCTICLMWRSLPSEAP